jgi:hypothetical protein
MDPRSGIALAVAREGWSPRDILAHGVINYHPTTVGPAQVHADHLQEWLKAGAADGFWISPDIYEDGVDAFVDEVVPLLRARGIYPEHYRRNPAGEPPRTQAVRPRPPHHEPQSGVTTSHDEARDHVPRAWRGRARPVLSTVPAHAAEPVVLPLQEAVTRLPVNTESRDGCRPVVVDGRDPRISRPVRHCAVRRDSPAPTMGEAHRTCGGVAGATVHLDHSMTILPRHADSREDAEFLRREAVLPPQRISAVETARTPQSVTTSPPTSKRSSNWNRPCTPWT